MENEKKQSWGGMRAGAGRPKGALNKNAKGTTRVVFQVSCQPDELEAIEARAKELALSKSAYIISLVKKDL